MLKAGEAAPNFSIPDHQGNQVALADFRGKRVVLWFYPKADTPGWTREGCGFRDLQQEFQAKGAEILGVSFDSMTDNAAFAEKYRIPYPLLSDADMAVAKAYGAYNDRNPGAPRRNTYVIDAEGLMEMTFEGVNPKTFPRALLDALT